MNTSTSAAPARLEDLIKATGAEQDGRHPEWAWTYTGECPVCRRPSLYLEAWERGEGEAHCGSACDALEVAEALGVDPSHVRVYENAGLDDDGEPVALTVLRLTHRMALVDYSRSSDALPLVDAVDLGRLPQPEPLIENTLDRRTVAMLVGEYGSGKSFLALEWAACIATGTPWDTGDSSGPREAVSGRVLYVAAEGAAGLQKRRLAWEKARGRTIEPGRLMFLPMAPQIAQKAPYTPEGEPRRKSDLERLLDVVAALKPDLVVFDTLARIAVGLEENSSTAMGELVAALDDVKVAMSAWGGSVLVVHHTGKNGRGARGSSAVGGAMDTIYEVDGDAKADGLTLDRTKRKDGPTDDFRAFSKREVEVEWTDADGVKHIATSIVLDATEYSPTSEDYAEEAERIIRYLYSHESANKDTLMSVAEVGKGKLLRILSALTDPDAPVLEWVPTLKKDGTPWGERGTYVLTPSERGRFEARLAANAELREQMLAERGGGAILESA